MAGGAGSKRGRRIPEAEPLAYPAGPEDLDVFGRCTAAGRSKRQPGAPQALVQHKTWKVKEHGNGSPTGAEPAGAR